MGLYFVTCLDTKHITLHMVPSFLYDHAKSALPGTPLPSNPSWSTDGHSLPSTDSRRAVVCYWLSMLNHLEDY